MAKTYTSTIKIDCWKEHTCAGCGAIYSYNFKRTATGQAPSPDKATERARASAARIMERDVDLHPCLTCGMYQPDMIGQTRAKRHKVMFWLMIIAAATVLILRASYAVQANTLTWVAVGLCGLAAFVHIGAEFKNYNLNLEANKQLASERVSTGAIRHTPGRNLPDSTGPIGKSSGQMLAAVALLGAVALTAAPELLRSQQHWPLNPDLWPPVAGPGDKPRVYMNQSIASVNGYWRADPDVVLHPADNPRANIPATGETNQNTWGSSISVKSGNSSNKSYPWVEIQLPDDERLAGKTVTADINMNVSYPEAVGSSSFRTAHDKMQGTATMNLAPAHAGSRYNNWWWEMTAGGMALSVICGIALTKAGRALQRSATPTRMLVAA